MSFVQPKFDPKRSFNRYLNGFQNNPGWVLETLASGMDIKIAGSIMGALLNFALIFGVEIFMIDGWRGALGWNGYRPGFSVLGFYTWAVTIAAAISILVIVVGKTTAPKGSRVGFEKFVTLLFAMLPLFLLGPMLGALITLVLLVVGYVVLSFYSFTTIHRGTEIAGMVIFPMATALLALWLVSLAAGWFSVSQSLPAGATGPRYDQAQATAQAAATQQSIKNAAATMTIEWCALYCTPQAAAKQTENARHGLSQETPVPGVRGTTPIPTQTHPACKADEYWSVVAGKCSKK